MIILDFCSIISPNQKHTSTLIIYSLIVAGAVTLAQCSWNRSCSFPSITFRQRTSEKCTRSWVRWGTLEASTMELSSSRPSSCRFTRKRCFCRIYSAYCPLSKERIQSEEASTRRSAMRTSHFLKWKRRTRSCLVMSQHG